LPEDVTGVPVAAIGKVGVPSVSGGYGAADMIWDDLTDAIRQRTCHDAKDVPVLGKRFSASYHFEGIDPKIHRSYQKLSF